MNDRKRFAPAAVGASSLLTIFAVLCLVVFALLSISTVQADLRLSETAARSVQGYYEADCRAEEILALLRAGECPPGVNEKDGIFSYACPISHTQTLVVEVAVDGKEYTVLRWQAVSTADWQSDDSLPVWDGTVPEEEENGRREP